MSEIVSSIKTKIKLWVIAPATILLLGSGYFFGDWNADKGYPLIQKKWDANKSVFVNDTISFIADSLTCVKMSNKIYSDFKRNTKLKIVGGKLFFTAGNYDTTDINDTTKLIVEKYEDANLEIEKTKDGFSIAQYSDAYYYVINNNKETKNYSGTFVKDFGYAFKIGQTRSKGKWVKTKYAIDYKAGTYTIYNIASGDSVDPGYATVALAPSIAFLPSADSLSNQPSYTGKYAEWNFNTPDSAADSVSSFDATFINSAIIGETVRYGSGALQLNGNNAYVTAGNLDALNGRDDMTISFWCNQTVVNATDIMFYITGATNLIQIYSGGSDKIFLDFKWGGLSTSRSINYSTCTNETWWHFAMAFDTGTLKAYLNGNSVTITAESGTIRDTVPDMGASLAQWGHSGLSLLGYIDNAKIDTVALTAIQVATMYAASRERYFVDTTEGFAILDTTFNGSEIDSINAISAVGSATHSLTDGLLFDISSIMTANTNNTIKFLAVNNIGGADTISHVIYYLDTKITTTRGLSGSISGGWTGGWTGGN